MFKNIFNRKISTECTIDGNNIAFFRILASNTATKSIEYSLGLNSHGFCKARICAVSLHQKKICKFFVFHNFKVFRATGPRRPREVKAIY